MYNYRNWVKSIQLEVHQTATYTLQGEGVLNLAELVHNTPLLTAVELYHQFDMVPYHQLYISRPWAYPPALFEALDKSVNGEPVRLHSWRWSCHLLRRNLVPDQYREGLQMIQQAHLKPSFQQLQKLAIVNFGRRSTPESRLFKESDVAEFQKSLATALTSLPSLRNVTFEASPWVDHILMAQLPTNLNHLDITFCPVEPNELAEFLLTHGSQLRSLTLNHNSRLNLSFLPVLGDACPQLTILKVNMLLYNALGTPSEMKPTFENLLEEDEVPVWPATLQHLEMIHLRQLDAHGAETFFQSLLDSAEMLKDLRTLIIKATLGNISWKERGVLRNKWTREFERVFKRVDTPPNPHLRSVGAWKHHQEELKKLQDAQVISDDEVPLASLKKPSPTTMSKHPAASGPSANGDSRKRSLRSSSPSNKRQRISKRTSLKEDSSSELGNEEEAKSARGSPDEASRRARLMSREVAALTKTTGVLGPKHPQSQQSRSISPIDDELSEQLQSDSDAPLSRSRARKLRLSHETHETKRTSSPPLNGKGKQAANKEQFIQGFCTVVEFSLDNLRPNENLFTENDFLDSEPEGDADWDEDAEEDFEGGGYAW
jgi:hypothetical protein